MSEHTRSVFAVPDLPLDPRIRVFRRVHANLQVDAYNITTERFVIICDTLLCPEDAQILLETVQQDLPGRQLLVFNSHSDWDHVWGNSYFTETHMGTPPALIIGHQLAAARLGSAESLAFLHDSQQRDALFKHVVLTPPTLTFDHKLTILGGDLTLEFLHTPGHCPDHCALWLPELRLLLAFDAVEWPLPTIENAHGVSAMQTTLDTLQQLQPQTVLCSHGETTQPHILQDNSSYLQTLKKRCRTVLATQPASALHTQQPSQLIQYPYEEVLGATTQPPIALDHTFYRDVHEQNIRNVFQWLLL